VAMSLRMTPVEKTFKRMTRLVRDVAHKRARQVQLIVDGEDTEVDKSIAEIISDPLVHVLRNAVDHGIESPADRVAAGKPAEGTVRLSARHQGGEVWVTIEDDGRGLDKDAIYAKAVERGLTEKPLHALSDREVFGFVFAPGFSTAEVLSDISGRGVGMDVARRNLESVNGRVDVHSVAGKGTTVTLRIPLTLAIIEGMLVRVGEAWFTIPMLQVQESVRVPESAITVLHTGQEMVRIRNRLLPVLRLHDLYRIEEAMTHIPDGLLVVVEDDTEAFCLFVDELIGQRQTVIKSLSGFVGNLNGLSGCTVLGDGRISLILDVAELHRRNLGSRGRTA
jgi:two-component system chemotaxis sensor kinase CheA